MMLNWPTYEQKMAIFGELGYVPHEGQDPAHRSLAQMLAIVGAERSGKSEFVDKEIVGRLPFCTEGVAIAAEEYDEAHREMKYIIEDLVALDALESCNTPSTGKWIIRVRGGLQIETVSLKNGPVELTTKGAPYDIVALVEWGVIRFDAFKAAMRRVSETRGLVICCGTLQDSVGWQVDILNAVKAEGNIYGGEGFEFPAWFNLAVFPKGRQDPEILRLERTLPADEFDRTVAAKIVVSPARIYPTFDFTRHVKEADFDRDLGVVLSVDPGYMPSRYAVAVLQVAEESFTLEGEGTFRMDVVRQIDEVWENHLMHQDVYEMCRKREWWGNLTKVLLGHEGDQHQATHSCREVWYKRLRDEGKRVWMRGMPGSLGDEPPVVPVEVFDAGRILDGVMRVQTFLVDPDTKLARYRCNEQCIGTQFEFGHYARRTDSRKQVISDEPVDADNDMMDALRNFFVWRFGLVDRRPATPTPGRKRIRANA